MRPSGVCYLRVDRTSLLQCYTSENDPEEASRPSTAPSGHCSLFQVMSNECNCGLRRCSRIPTITMDENQRDRAF